MSKLEKLLRPLSSLYLTVFCLAYLMVIVLSCTFAQVHLGIYGAVDRYIRSMFIYGKFFGLNWRVPFFPGGSLIGLILLINLSATFITRFRLIRKKAGIWLIHIGIIIFVFGEFVTGAFQVETQLEFEEGQSKNYTEHVRESEFAVVDTTKDEYDEVYSIPLSQLSRKEEVSHPRLPFSFHTKKFYSNSKISIRSGSEPLSLATIGPGTRMSVQRAANVSRDDEQNVPSAFVEIRDGDQSLGVWLFSLAIEQPQTLTHQGRQFSLTMRPEREYLPYTLKLIDFTHDRYPGTEIPKNFSSLVRLTHPEKGEDRDVLIYMNHPLRYDGKAFYQSSFGKEDTLSVLQVVRNPGWLLPYIAFVLTSIGLIYQFVSHFLRFIPAQKKKGAESF